MIEVRYLTAESPFRGPCWAVIRDGCCVAYCFAASVAYAIRATLNMQDGETIHDGDRVQVIRGPYAGVRGWAVSATPDGHILIDSWDRRTINKIVRVPKADVEVVS